MQTKKWLQMESQMTATDQTCWRTMLLELYPQTLHPLTSLKQEDDLPIIKHEKTFYTHTRQKNSTENRSICSHSSPPTAKIRTLLVECKQQLCIILVGANNQNTANKQFAIMPPKQRSKEKQTNRSPKKTPHPHHPKKGPELNFCFCKGF